jgi:hypothetical protein
VLYDQDQFMGNSSLASGIALLVFAMLVASEIITRVTGTYSHWPFVIAGIVMGLIAAKAIR